jgi:large subunit ribosomal protein L10
VRLVGSPLRAQPESDEMNRDEKAAVIDQIAADIGGSEAIFAVDYRGITVAQIKDLRDKLGDTNASLRVTKNSLAERAADQAGVPELKPLLVGPTALAFVRGDAAAAAKVLADTARVLRGPLASKGGLLSGELLTAAQVDAIAKLPSRDVLYGQLVGMVAAPLAGVARGLNALIQGLALQLGAIQEQGLVGSGAPAAAEAPAPATDEDAPAAEAPASSEPSAAAPDVEATAPETDASDDATNPDA